MKKFRIFVLFCLLLAVGSCRKDVLDTRVDTQLTKDELFTDYSKLWDLGYAPYTYLRDGFSAIDDNLFAAVTDDAVQTAPTAKAQLFTQGSWNAYSNPDSSYNIDYDGIRAANYFLETSENYKVFLAVNRDTVSDNQRQYKLDVQDIAWLRGEVRVLRAYFYFDLTKRYGGVPLVTKTLSLTDNTDLPRANYDDIIEFIVSEIDAVKDSLQADWSSYDVARTGRITLGAALALKSRVLLYAASPLHNPSGDKTKWERAAAAAHDVINLNRYTLNSTYEDLFLGDNILHSSENIWSIRLGPTSDLEEENYPVGTPGGHSGVTPSQNLVSAYEYKSMPDPNDPYANRDPRLSYTVVTNNSIWNGRTIETWPGGTDGREKVNTSKTGYYLKKFLNPNLNLIQSETRPRSWIVFRYAEILLNYAEAMNEAFGPDNNNGWGISARDAITAVRGRSDVNMPPVKAASQDEMREAIKHERRIELAFEGHRYWDLLRWKDAETVLNEPLRGMRINRNPDNSFSYTEFSVESRKFIAPKMYYYPFPYTEVAKSNGILEQNPGW